MYLKKTGESKNQQERFSSLRTSSRWGIEGCAPNLLQANAPAAAAYILMDTLRREGLAGTEPAHAQIGTIRNKLLKIGARVVCSVRRLVFHLAGGYPYNELFAQILGRLCTTPSAMLASG